LLRDGTALGGYPNGIALSPDERTLYLSSGPRRVMKYAVLADDTLGEGSVFLDNADGVGDGMRTDRAGNLFSTNGAGPGVVRITSPQGVELGRINLPVFDTEPKRQICATNVAFGSRDGKTLYIAACEAVYRLQLQTPGTVPGSTP
jgi:gluconolactonase